MSDASALTVSVGHHQIGPEHRALVIGEVAQAHDGSLGFAHAFVDAIADAGADAIKFQTHIATAESTTSEPFRVPFSPADATRFGYWQRIEFSEQQWQGLAKHARNRGLIFLSSPFSIEAINLLERAGVPAWKVSSGEVGNHLLLRRMAVSGLPVLLSSGMSGTSELDASVELLRSHDARFAILQCTSKYPTGPEAVGLNQLAELRNRYGCPVGLSDHSGTIFASLAAVTLGADLIEVHVTMSREMFGPDVASSVTTGELRELIAGVRFVETALAHPIDKNAVADELAPLRESFGRSIVAAQPIAAGTVLEESLLALKKPGGGIPAERLRQILGHRTTRDLEPDDRLAEGDLE